MAARTQHITVFGKEIICASWPLIPGYMNAFLVPNSRIEGVRERLID
jgi:hypothetical protein